MCGQAIQKAEGMKHGVSFIGFVSDISVVKSLSTALIWKERFLGPQDQYQLLSADVSLASHTWANGYGSIHIVCDNNNNLLFVEQFML